MKERKKKIICNFSPFCYSQIICEQNLILTDLLNIQNSQNIFQAMSCLQIICFQYGCVFNCLLSIILCCWLEEQKISEKKGESKLHTLISICMSREQALSAEVNLWFSCTELWEANKFGELLLCLQSGNLAKRLGNTLVFP